MVGVEGQFDHAVPRPYRISYRCIRPKRADRENLFVPTVISATHPEYGSSRMEPVFTTLGQSAGAAAAIAIDEKIAVQDVGYAPLRAVLLVEGQLLDSSTRRDCAAPAYRDHGRRSPCGPGKLSGEGRVVERPAPRPRAAGSRGNRHEGRRHAECTDEDRGLLGVARAGRNGGERR